MSNHRLLEEIERLRAEMERRSRTASFSSKNLLKLSERLDRLINAYLRGGQGRTPKKDLRLSRHRFKIKVKV